MAFLSYTSATTRRQLIDQLRGGVVTISFEKDNGEVRTLDVTLRGTAINNNLRHVAFLVAEASDLTQIKTIRWNKIISVQNAVGVGARRVPVGVPDLSLGVLGAASKSVQVAKATRADELQLLADLKLVGFENHKPVNDTMLLKLCDLRVDRATKVLNGELDRLKRELANSRDREQSLNNAITKLKGATLLSLEEISSLVSRAFNKLYSSGS